VRSLNPTWVVRQNFGPYLEDMPVLQDHSSLLSALPWIGAGQLLFSGFLAFWSMKSPRWAVNCGGARAVVTGSSDDPVRVAEFIASREELIGARRIEFLSLLLQSFREANRILAAERYARLERIALGVAAMLAVGTFLAGESVLWSFVFACGSATALWTYVCVCIRERRVAGCYLFDTDENEWQSYCIEMRPSLLAFRPGLLDANLRLARFVSAKTGDAAVGS